MAGLLLSGIQFQEFEIPEQVPWAGKHQFKIHKLPGGDRVIDAMGPDDRDIQWSGIFQGSGAVTRARAIDAIRNAGAQVSLSWGSFSRQVVVSDFEPDYEREYQVPYRITCVVVPTAASTSSTTTTTLTGLTSSDIGNAVTSTITAVSNGNVTAASIISSVASGNTAAALAALQGLGLSSATASTIITILQNSTASVP